MCVTDIVRPLYEYNNDWKEPTEPDLEKQINNYNLNRNRFLFFGWGVWVTAFARRNLFTGIMECGQDYCYSDTDSIKLMNEDKHIQYFEEYNKRIVKQLLIALKYHGIDENAICPKTIKGIKKYLGVWDFDGHYESFKTLGAKRYLVRYSNDTRNEKKDRNRYNLTVAGLNKQKCVPYLLSKFGNKIFEEFKNGLYIPPNETGKNTHTYIDEVMVGEVEDYRGVIGKYNEKSAIHLEEADYSLSISREYRDYLLDIKDSEL